VKEKEELEGQVAAIQAALEAATAAQQGKAAEGIAEEAVGSGAASTASAEMASLEMASLEELEARLGKSEDDRKKSDTAAEALAESASKAADEAAQRLEVECSRAEAAEQRERQAIETGNTYLTKLQREQKTVTELEGRLAEMVQGVSQASEAVQRANEEERTATLAEVAVLQSRLEDTEAQMRARGQGAALRTLKQFMVRIVKGEAAGRVDSWRAAMQAARLEALTSAWEASKEALSQSEKVLAIAEEEPVANTTPETATKSETVLATGHTAVALVSPHHSLTTRIAPAKPTGYGEWPLWKQKKWEWQHSPKKRDQGDLYHYDKRHPDMAFIPEAIDPATRPTTTPVMGRSPARSHERSTTIRSPSSPSPH